MKRYNFHPIFQVITISASIFYVFISSSADAAGLCDTRVRKPSSIDRMCTYTIDSTKITNFISVHSGAISSGDKTTLQNIANAPAQGISSSFASQIATLRVLSYEYTTPSVHDALYVFHAGSCTYTTRYANNDICQNDANTFPPLIDRIKPTIEIKAQIGRGSTSPDTLLRQEGGAMNNVGNFLAGSGTIFVTLVDSGSSTFTPISTWSGFNGISGIKGYQITLCQTKTHTGLVINRDESGNPSCAGSGGVNPMRIIFQNNPPETTSGSYNPNGLIFIPHIIPVNINLSDISGIQVAGEYQVFVGIVDEAGNVNTGTAKFNIYPEGLDPSRTTIIKYDNPSDFTAPHVIYTITGSNSPLIGGGSPVSTRANAIDKQSYKLSIYDVYGNPVYNWNLYDFALSATGIFLDGISKTGSSALFVNTSTDFTNTLQTVTTDFDGAIRFHVSSYAPGEFAEQVSYGIKAWDKMRTEIGEKIPMTFPSAFVNTGSFYHIFTGAIELQTTNRIDLGTHNDIRLGFYTTSSVSNTTLEEFSISNFLESLTSLDPTNFIITSTGSYLSDVSFVSAYPNPSYLMGASGTFTPEQVGSLFTSTLRIETWPYITLSFGSPLMTTRYYLSNNERTYGSGLIYGSGGLNRIYVEGNKRTTGKEGYVDVTSSIGSTNSADIRNTIHKNAAILLRNRKPESEGGRIINRVKFVTGNQTSSTLDNDINAWDTVIIKGGSLTIDEDFNIASDLKSVKQKGIIVLSDDISEKGFVYIKPAVRFIGAIIFADESLQSVDENGNIFTVSDSARTSTLNKQLVFYGGIFSKNTVGGAVRANSSGNYVLPWKETTNNLDEAVKYDLAFLRMDNKEQTTLNRGRHEFVIIFTNPRSLSNPLPGFARVQ